MHHAYECLHAHIYTSMSEGTSKHTERTREPISVTERVACLHLLASWLKLGFMQRERERERDIERERACLRSVVKHVIQSCDAHRVCGHVPACVQMVL